MRGAEMSRTPIDQLRKSMDQIYEASNEVENILFEFQPEIARMGFDKDLTTMGLSDKARVAEAVLGIHDAIARKTRLAQAGGR